MNTNKPVNYNH